MSLALVFPGQGSQSVGMGRGWYERFAQAREVYDTAGSALGYDMAQLCFEGPEDKLVLTEYTQPAILATSVAIWRCLTGTAAPEFFAGHSLGEYTALVASGSLALTDALQLVSERGRLMQQAVPVGAGAMAAVLNLAAAEIDRINRDVARTSGLVLETANYNSPAQIVVSGHAVAVAQAKPLYLDAGAKRVVELPVSAPFHCSLMSPVAARLAMQLARTQFEPVEVPVIANLTAQPYPGDTTEYQRLLSMQIYNSVRWTDTIALFSRAGVTHVLEVGPGKVLRGLTPRITEGLGLPSLACSNLEQPEQLDEALAFVDQAAADLSARAGVNDD